MQPKEIGELITKFAEAVRAQEQYEGAKNE